MACYIASSDNRFYAGIEPEYGTAAAISAVNRVPAIGLRIRQEPVAPPRLDKTGGRTFTGLPSGLRKTTTFELSTLLVGWPDPLIEPNYGPLFRAALGSAALIFSGGTVQFVPDPTRLVFSGSHGLSVDQAITFEGEIRFAAAIIDAQTIILNAPFTTTPGAGEPIGPAVTYLPANKVPSLSIFDFWDPGDSIHRILTGGGVDRMQLGVNGDFHQFIFSGLGRELVDSVSFSGGQGGLSTFPAEPAVAEWNYSPVPGNLGQAWFGAAPQQFFSLLEAQVSLDNDLDLRSKEFGSDVPMCMAPGQRTVTAGFRLYANTRPETTELYQASRQRSPISMMLQLGQTGGHLCGVYMKSIVPEVPEFDDSETRMQWRFRNCRAQGTANDELVVAFG